MRAWRGAFGVASRECLRIAAPATLAATAVAAVAGSVYAPVLAGDAPLGAAASLWIALPLFVAAAACCLVAARTWPTFARRRQGADAVRRIARGPLGGRGAAAIGACVAQLVLSLLVVAVLPPLLDVPPTARRHLEAQVGSPPVLARRGATLRCELPEPVVASELLLRPRAALPTGREPTSVRVTCGGAALHEAAVTFEESLELVRMPIAARELGAVTLTQLGGDVPLLFVDGSVVVVSAEQLPRFGNGALLALLACAASLATMLVAGVLGLGAGWPTVASVICAVLFAQWVAGAGPTHDAVLAFARGQWLG